MIKIFNSEGGEKVEKSCGNPDGKRGIMSMDQKSAAFINCIGPARPVRYLFVGLRVMWCIWLLAWVLFDLPGLCLVA
jgi:hypothetical protein